MVFKDNDLISEVSHRVSGGGGGGSIPTYLFLEYEWIEVASN